MCFVGDCALFGILLVHPNLLVRTKAFNDVRVCVCVGGGKGVVFCIVLAGFEDIIWKEQ